MLEKENCNGERQGGKGRERYLRRNGLADLEVEGRNKRGQIALKERGKELEI